MPIVKTKYAKGSGPSSSPNASSSSGSSGKSALDLRIEARQGQNPLTPEQQVAQNASRGILTPSVRETTLKREADRSVSERSVLNAAQVQAPAVTGNAVKTPSSNRDFLPNILKGGSAKTLNPFQQNVRVQQGPSAAPPSARDFQPTPNTQPPSVSVSERRPRKERTGVFAPVLRVVDTVTGERFRTEAGQKIVNYEPRTVYQRLVFGAQRWSEDFQLRNPVAYQATSLFPPARAALEVSRAVGLSVAVSEGVDRQFERELDREPRLPDRLVLSQARAISFFGTRLDVALLPVGGTVVQAAVGPGAVKAGGYVFNFLAGGTAIGKTIQAVRTGDTAPLGEATIYAAPGAIKALKEPFKLLRIDIIKPDRTRENVYTGIEYVNRYLHTPTGRPVIGVVRGNAGGSVFPDRNVMFGTSRPFEPKGVGAFKAIESPDTVVAFSGLGGGQIIRSEAVARGISGEFQRLKAQEVFIVRTASSVQGTNSAVQLKTSNNLRVKNIPNTTLKKLLNRLGRMDADVYGSFAQGAQKVKALRRPSGDLDVNFADRSTKSVQEDVNPELLKVMGKGYRQNRANPSVIETLKGEKVLDVHGYDTVDLKTPRAPELLSGIKPRGRNIRVDKAKVRTLDEELAAKGQSLFNLRRSGGVVTLGPEPSRAKDIFDLFAATRQLRGTSYSKTGENLFPTQLFTEAEVAVGPVQVLGGARSPSVRVPTMSALVGLSADLLPSPSRAPSRSGGSVLPKLQSPSKSQSPSSPSPVSPFLDPGVSPSKRSPSPSVPFSPYSPSPSRSPSRSPRSPSPTPSPSPSPRSPSPSPSPSRSPFSQSPPSASPFTSVPPLDLPSGSRGSGAFGFTFKAPRKYKYTPTVSALDLNLRGVAPKSLKGLEIRPLPTLKRASTKRRRRRS